MRFEQFPTFLFLVASGSAISIKNSCTSVADYAIALVVFSDDVVLSVRVDIFEFFGVSLVFHFALG